VQYQLRMQVVRAAPERKNRWFIGAKFSTPLNQSDLRSLLV
jgi:hypothetical protein